MVATRADNDIIGHGYDHTDLARPEPVHPLVPTGVVPNPDPDLVHFRMSLQSSIDGQLNIGAVSPCIWPDGTQDPQPR